MARKLTRLLFWCLMLWLLALLLLPVIYRFINPPLTSPLLARYLTLQRVEYHWQPLASLPPALVRSLIGMEDARFCDHNGVDWRELNKVLQDENGPSRGASTITMQLTRNLMLWNGGGVVFGGLRKMLEIPLAHYVELVLPKRRIIELYLNTAELGPNGQFGISAGAAHAYGKSATLLNESQSAMLIAILANPKEFSARNPGLQARRRGAIALARGRDANVDCVQEKD